MFDENPIVTQTAQPMEGTYTVEYTVPLVVVVDLETRTCTKVVICDEESRLAHVVRTEGGDEIKATTREWGYAIDVAETAGDGKGWPRWEFGW